MAWWQYIEVWMVAQGPNSKARRLACPPHGHHVTVVLPPVPGGLGMSSGSGAPLIGVRKKKTIEESHEETESSSNMN